MDRLRLRNDIPGHNAMDAHTSSAMTAPLDTGRLAVGRDVVLSGEISSCADLLVEGTVKAELKNGKHIEITETGRFDGTLEVENAEISGFFDGTLRVSNRLVLRPSAEIKGELFYGMIEVHPGARIEGKMTALDLPVEDSQDKEDTASTAEACVKSSGEDSAAFDMDDIINRISGDEEQLKTLPFRNAANG